MTKQEEIREWVSGCVRAVRNDRSPQAECLFEAATKNILEGLHSRGVVLLEDKVQKYSEQTGQPIEPTPYKILTSLI